MVHSKGGRLRQVSQVIDDMSVGSGAKQMLSKFLVRAGLVNGAGSLVLCLFYTNK